MSNLPRITAVPSAKVEEIGMRFYEGVAYTADGGVVIAATEAEAHRLARRCFGFDLDATGAEQVVLIRPDKFRELMARAGLPVPEVA